MTESRKECVRMVAREFNVCCAPAEIVLLENGHINDTYVFTTASNKYIIQKINRYVFKNPEKIMQNIENVTDHLQKKIEEEQGNIERDMLHFLHHPSGTNYFKDSDGEFWRICPFIDRTTTFEQVENLTMLYNAGFAFGKFQRMLADYPMQKLHETIPDFHNTQKRLNDFFEVVEQDACNRVKDVQPEIQFFTERRKSAGLFTEMIKDGTMPLRVTHNDTKYNNILIDKDTFDAVCVIDLDTVMPGLAVYDFGDAIRFAASTALEDETDLSKVTINMEYFESFTKGFIGASNGFFTKVELDNMAQGCINITIELASRFLADHMNGDQYFRIHHPNHNLERARNQIHLAQEMERNFEKMKAIVSRYEA